MKVRACWSGIVALLTAPFVFASIWRGVKKWKAEARDEATRERDAPLRHHAQIPADEHEGRGSNESGVSPAASRLVSRPLAAQAKRLERVSGWWHVGVAVLALALAMVVLLPMYQYVFPEEPVDTGDRGGVELWVPRGIDLAGGVASLERSSSAFGDSVKVTVVDGVDAVGLALTGYWASGAVTLSDPTECWESGGALLVLESSAELEHGQILRDTAPECSTVSAFTLRWQPQRGWSGPIPYVHFDSIEVAVTYDAVDQMPSPTGFLTATVSHSATSPLVGEWLETGNGLDGSWLVRNVDACHNTGISSALADVSSCSITATVASSGRVHAGPPRIVSAAPSPNTPPSPQKVLVAHSPGGSVDWEPAEYQSTREALLMAMGVILGLVATVVYSGLHSGGRWMIARVLSPRT